jgi:hypothetical protein
MSNLNTPSAAFLHCIILLSLILIPSAQAYWKIIPDKRIEEMKT